MAEHGQARWHPPLKTPAVEIVDLLSGDEDVGEALAVSQTNDERDASDESESDDDSQLSLYEDVLQLKDDKGLIHDGKRYRAPPVPYAAVINT